MVVIIFIYILNIFKAFHVVDYIVKIFTCRVSNNRYVSYIRYDSSDFLSRLYISKPYIISYHRIDHIPTKYTNITSK